MKHYITKEEIDFLLRLQKEMNTQDHVSQADPRFWVIKGTRKEYGIKDGYGDDACLVDTEDGNTIAETMNEAVVFITEELLDEIMDKEWQKLNVSLIEGNQIEITWTEEEENCSETLCDLEEVASWLEEKGYDSYRYEAYRNVDIIYPNTMFLTQKEAEEHLRANYYHYSEDAHTYAMTAWRSPDVEMLWNILQKVNWSKLI